MRTIKEFKYLNNNILRHYAIYLTEPAPESKKMRI